MRVGFIGVGTMGGATARSLCNPVLCCDAGSGRAAQLVSGWAARFFLTIARWRDRWMR